MVIVILGQNAPKYVETMHLSSSHFFNLSIFLFQIQKNIKFISSLQDWYLREQLAPCPAFEHFRLIHNLYVVFFFKQKRTRAMYFKRKNTTKLYILYHLSRGEGQNVLDIWYVDIEWHQQRCGHDNYQQRETTHGDQARVEMTATQTPRAPASLP